MHNGQSMKAQASVVYSIDSGALCLFNEGDGSWYIDEKTYLRISAMGYQAAQYYCWPMVHP